MKKIDNIDMKELLKKSRSANPQYTDSMSFKLTPEQKAVFVKLCKDKGVSVGVLIRNMIDAAIPELEKL